MNSAMFYMYFGLMIATIGITQLLLVQYGSWTNRRNMWSNEMLLTRNHSDIHPLYVFNEPFIVWFGKSCKRMYTTDDDLEDADSSYFIKADKIRGGQLWSKIRYAQPLINIK